MSRSGNQILNIIKKPARTFIRELDYFIWSLKYSKRLERFRNIHYNEDCFIICNGPSLNEMDLTPLNGYYTFGLNKIYLIFKKVELSLSYHVAVNNHVVDQASEQLSSFTWPMFIEHKPGKSLAAKNKNIFLLKGGKNLEFCQDITQPICQGHTVTYVAMQIAFYMGFKNVFLIGCDHNFAQKGKPNELQVMKEDDLNHFDPNYFKGMKWNLADLDSSEIAYFMAKKHYEKAGRKIWNATKGGKLEIFDRVDYKEALAMAKKKVIS